MLQGEIIQVIQMVIILFVTFLLAYSFVQNFRCLKTVSAISAISFYINAAVLYERSLYVVNYNCYHKFEIWRKYRFS